MLPGVALLALPNLMVIMSTGSKRGKKVKARNQSYTVWVASIIDDVETNSGQKQESTEKGAASAPNPVTSVALGPYSAQIHWTLPEAPNGVITDCGEYTFSVQAINAGGLGEAGTHSSTTDAGEPGDIIGFSNANITSDSIFLIWNNLTTNCPVTKYDLHVEGKVLWNEKTENFDKDIPEEHQYFLLENLTPYTSYNISLRATTKGGTTNYVSQVLETLEGVAAAPVDLTASTIDDTSVSLSWSESPAINGLLKSYHITCKKSLTDLTLDCDEYTGDLTYDVPSEPANFKATVLDSRRVRLTWDVPEFQNGDRLEDYYLSYDLLGNENEEIVLGRIVETYTLGDDDSETLLPCQTYNIRLRASNENGIGSAASLRVKLDAEKPNPVALLRCNVVDSHSAELKWNVDPTTCRIKYYTISLNYNIEWGDSNNTVVNETNIPPNGGSLTLTDLIADTIYDITLQPGNDAGLGEAKSCQQLVTDLDVPEAPEDLKVTDSSKSKLEINWLAPKMRNGVLTSFKITWGENGQAFVDAVNDTSNVYSYSIEDLDDIRFMK
ncbi:Receptor-type tyrosine-protein phosphatase F [Armadillidium vulgare]|nr:Receptor-type tyrosine-protein phosphatase F [Armadillidium vulgare]